MIYILTTTNTILQTQVRPQESGGSDNAADGLLSLKLKKTLSTQSFDEQQKYLSIAAIAAYIALNKLDQRQSFRAKVDLISTTGESFHFSQGSSSSGLGYALALFETWWTKVLDKPGIFPSPVFATGEILPSGELKPIAHLSDKINAVCTYIQNNGEQISSFYLCYPEKNHDEITQKQITRIKKLGGHLLPANRLHDVLGELLKDHYDGDPLGRWEPFKGLNSFNYEDSVRFFGRGKDIERLYDDIQQN